MRTNYFVAFLVSLSLMLSLLWMGGELSPLHEGPTARCEQLQGPRGVEDLAPDHARGLLYASADDRRALLRGAEPLGALFVIRGDSKSFTQLRLINERGAPIEEHFHPHGIDLIEREGRGYLWVVNHPFGLGRQAPQGSAQHQLERFEIDNLDHPTTLKRTLTLTHPLLTSPNDLVALSADEVYVSNDHGSESRLGRAFETLTRRAWGGVAHYHQGEWRLVHQRTAYANGLAASPDGARLFLASANGGGLQSFELSGEIEAGESEAFKLRDHQEVSRSLDNLTWDQSGHQLLIAAHPRPLRFLLHALFEGIHSPTELWSVTYHPHTKSLSPAQLLLSAQNPFSGGSVVAQLDDTLWIGTVFEGVGWCELTNKLPLNL